MLLTSGCPGPIWAVQHSSATLRLLSVIDDMHHSVSDETAQSAAALREEVEAIEFKQQMDALFSGGASSQSPDAVMRSASPADRSASPPLAGRVAGGASSKANGAGPAAAVVPLSRRLDAELALVPMTNKPIASMFQRHEQQQAQKLQELRAAREARREAAGRPPRRSKYIELSFVSAHAQLPPDVATALRWLRSHALAVVAVPSLHCFFFPCRAKCSSVRAWLGSLCCPRKSDASPPTWSADFSSDCAGPSIDLCVA